jgi:hypothetical protein
MSELEVAEAMVMRREKHTSNFTAAEVYVLFPEGRFHPKSPARGE